MIIEHPSHCRWLKPITDDNIAVIGGNKASRLRNTLNKIVDTSITHHIEPLTQSMIDWFNPLYVKIIGGKDNPNLSNIYDTTLGKHSQHPYFSLTLYEKGVPIGAAIFSERKDKAMISLAYRAFATDWTAHKLHTNPALYAEYLLCEYGSAKGFTILSHGRDRNPYGPNAGIGLALFKLSVGCYPTLPVTQFENLQLDTDQCTQDTFVVTGPNAEGRMTKGFLIVSERNFEKYTQLQKYPEVIDVITLPRKTE